MSKLLHSELTYYLRGIGYKIHNRLGGGHAEADFETALIQCLESDSVAYTRQPIYHINYREQQIGEYRPDVMVADNKVLLELKAAAEIAPLHIAQTLSYLGVTGAELGLILNFGAASMQFKRVPNFLHERSRLPNNHNLSTDALYPELTKQVLDNLSAVHFNLGSGFIHQVYRRATRIEFTHNGLSYQYLKELPLRFEGNTIAMKPTRLIWVEQKLLVAVVALSQLASAHSEKMSWALRETGCRLGLIANFYPSRLDFCFLRVS